MLLRDYVVNAAKTAGITDTDEAFKTFLDKGNDVLEIDDDLAKKISGNFHTMESAKQNSDLKNYFTATALNPLDSKLETLMEGLPDEVKAPILAEKNSYEKTAMLFKAVQVIADARVQEASKGDGADAGKIEEFNTKIKGLNDTILKLGTDHTAALQSKDDSLAVERLGWLQNSHFSSYDYANDKVSKDAHVITAKTLVNQAMVDKGLKLTNNNGSLTLKKEDGLDYIEDNKTVTYKDFADTVISTSGLLAVKDTPPVDPIKIDAGTGQGGDDYDTLVKNQQEFHATIPAMNG